MNILKNLNAIEIQKYQQNRYPLLFVDEITEVCPGKYAKGFKNFTYNEWFFPPHFEDEPVVPGFIQVEALTQTFLMTFLTLEGNEGKKAAFVSIQNAKFKRKIKPGEKLEMEAELYSFKRGLAKGIVKSKVAGEEALTIELIVSIPEDLLKYIPQ